LSWIILGRERDQCFGEALIHVRNAREHLGQLVFGYRQLSGPPAQVPGGQSTDRRIIGDPRPASAVGPTTGCRWGRWTTHRGATGTQTPAASANRNSRAANGEPRCGRATALSAVLVQALALPGRSGSTSRRSRSGWVAPVQSVVLSRAPTAGDYLTDVLPALLPVGFGAGLSFPSITAAALARLDEDTSGLASGLLSTVAQIAGALAIAILVALVSERSSDLIGSGSAPLAAQVGGFQLAFVIAAGVAQLGSLVAMFALPKGNAAEVAT
jgi:hypothetical protein